MGEPLVPLSQDIGQSASDNRGGAKTLYQRIIVQAQFHFRFVEDGDGIYTDIEPNWSLYPNGIKITEEMKDYFAGVADDNGFEYSEFKDKMAER